MPTTPDHAREYLHSRGMTDEQILAVEALNDQTGAWVRQAAHLAIQIRANLDRGDHAGVAEAQMYIGILQDHMRSELGEPENGRAWMIIHLLLSQAADLGRQLGNAQAEIAQREADDVRRSEEGRTDHDYEQRIGMAETRLREVADLVAAEPHGPYCKPWRLEQWPDDPVGCVCVKGRLTAVIEREAQR